MKRIILTVLFVSFVLFLNAQSGNNVMEKVFANYEKNYFVNEMSFDLNCLWLKSVNKCEEDTLCIGESKWRLPKITEKQKSERISHNFKGRKLSDAYVDILRYLYADYLNNKETYFIENDFDLKTSDNDLYVIVYRKAKEGERDNFTEYTFEINKIDYAVTKIKTESQNKEFKKPSYLFPIRYYWVNSISVLDYKKENDKYVMSKLKGEKFGEKHYLAKKRKKENVEEKYLYVISNVYEVKH